MDWHCNTVHSVSLSFSLCNYASTQKKEKWMQNINTITSCAKLEGKVSFFIQEYHVNIVLSSAVHSNKMLCMTDNIHYFWIIATALVVLWIYGKDFTMEHQFVEVQMTREGKCWHSWDRGCTCSAVLQVRKRHTSSKCWKDLRERKLPWWYLHQKTVPYPWQLSWPCWPVCCSGGPRQEWWETLTMWSAARTLCTWALHPEATSATPWRRSARGTRINPAMSHCTTPTDTSPSILPILSRSQMGRRRWTSRGCSSPRWVFFQAVSTNHSLELIEVCFHSGVSIQIHCAISYHMYIYLNEIIKNFIMSKDTENKYHTINYAHFFVYIHTQPVN